jgi:hypothetical protein
MVSCNLAIDMGLHVEILGHFTTRLRDFCPFEPLIPYVPLRVNPHKKDASIISPNFVQLVSKIHLLT